MSVGSLDRDFSRRALTQKNGNNARAGLQLDIERLFAQQIRSLLLPMSRICLLCHLIASCHVPSTIERYSARTWHFMASSIWVEMQIRSHTKWLSEKSSISFLDFLITFLPLLCIIIVLQNI